MYCRWRNKYIPEVKFKDISEATEAPDGLQLVAANGTGMPYVGWVEITFKLASPVDSVKYLVIPVLVLKDQRLSKPIIGYNVIEQVMRQSEASEDNEVGKGRLHKIVKYAFPGMKKHKIQTFINLVTTENPGEYLVKTMKDPMNIPKRTVMQIQCQVKMPYMKQDTAFLFEPHVNPQCTDGLEPLETLVTLQKGSRPVVKISIQNITDHDIRLAEKTELGTTQSIKSVLPTAVSHGATTAMISEVQKTTNANESNSENYGTHLLM